VGKHGFDGIGIDTRVIVRTSSHGGRSYRVAPILTSGPSREGDRRSAELGDTALLMVAAGGRSRSRFVTAMR